MLIIQVSQIFHLLDGGVQVTLHCRFRLWKISQPSVSVPPLRGRLGGG